jgi:hypothetical protein
MSEQDMLALPYEARVQLFRELLRDKDVSAFSTWEKEQARLGVCREYCPIRSTARENSGGTLRYILNLKAKHTFFIAYCTCGAFFVGSGLHIDCETVPPDRAIAPWGLGGMTNASLHVCTFAAFDARFKVLTIKERKAEFERYLRMRVQEEKKEKAAKIKEARDNFKAWLDALPLGPKMEFPDFTQKVR